MRRSGFAVLLSFFFFLSVARADEGKLEFSQQVMPFEKFSYLVWKPFWVGLPNNILKNYTAAVGPNGDTAYLRTGGVLAFSILVNSSVKSAGTQRYTSYEFQQKSGGFLVEIKTEGTKLQAVPIAEVRAGKLPVFPMESQAEFTEISISSPGSLDRFEITKRQEGEALFISVEVYTSSKGHVLSYREQSSPGYREFSYSWPADKWLGAAHTLGVTKIQTSDMLIGSEEFRIDNLPVSYAAYQNIFEKTLLSLATSYWNF